MPIRVKCDNCKKTLSVKDHLAGKKIKCPVCQSVVAVSPAPPTKGAAGDTPKPDGIKPAPKAAPTVAKKPVPVGKPAATAVKTPANGKKAGPATNGATNGKSEAHEPAALPPENVEDEAAAAFAAEERPPVEETPRTIEFKCEWCDEMVSLPLALAGKREQCPNPECRRIVKVPMPKVEAKRDWRKMDRVGPAAARINQPEQLENAWGTENTTKARQDSLAKAGAVELPPKPPLGVVGVLRYAVLVALVLALASGTLLGLVKLLSGNAHYQEIVAARNLVVGNPPKITTPVVAAHVHETMALLYMRDGKHGVTRPADAALEQFQAARARLSVKEEPGKDARVHEPLLLIEVSLAAIDLAGSEDEAIEKKKQRWPTISSFLSSSLPPLPADVEAMALRDISTRLLMKDPSKKNQAEITTSLLSLASSRSVVKDAAGVSRQTPAMSQQVALLVEQGKEELLPPMFVNAGDVLKELIAGRVPREIGISHLRIGFAEGYARKDKYKEAMDLIDVPGSSRDRLEASLGVATIARSRKPDEAGRFIDRAFEIASKERDASPWQMLQLIRLVAASPDSDARVNELKNDPRLKGPFKLRAYLEIVRARCDRATEPAPPEILTDIDELNDSTTRELAWFYLAQQHARVGQKRAQIQKTLADNAGKADPEKLRPVIEIGAIRGSVK